MKAKTTAAVMTVHLTMSMGQADAVAAHASLDELRFETDLRDFEAFDLLFDRLRLVVVVVVHG